MLRLGEIVHGKLIEAIDKHHWIVSFRGDLMQVKNLSPIKFEKNKIVPLKVVQESPIQLQVLSSQRSFEKKIDVKI